MKICHFIASTGFGGAEKVVIDIANKMALQHEVSILIPNESTYKKLLNANVKILTYKSRSRYNILTYFSVYQSLKKNNFQVINTHGAKATQILYVLNKFLKIPNIATKHNNRKGEIFNKVANVIAVSKEVKNSIKNKNISLIYNGIEPEIIQNKKNKKNTFSIIAIGRLDKIKGFDILINEVSKLKFDFLLEIIGDGKEKENLKKMIKNLKLDNKVKLLGHKTNIAKIMNEADLVVVSSIKEGFSLVALESFFYSNLLISTNVGISKEILDKNLIVLKNLFSEKILEVYENYEKYKNIFDLNIEKIKNSFLLENTTKSYIKSYKKIIKIGIIKFSALGDIALTIPTLNSLSQYNTTLITSPLGNQLISNEVNRKIVLNNKTLINLIKLIIQIRQENFNLILDFQCNDRSKLITTLLNSKIYNNKNIQVKENIIFEISKQANLKNNLDLSAKVSMPFYIVLNCGSSPKWVSKRIPFFKWKEISEILYKKYRLPFYLIGDDTEIEYIKELSHYIVTEKRILAGKTTLLELKEILKNAFLTVSTDSAAMHISASQKTPTIGIFGATNWLKSAPFGPWSTVIYDKTFYKKSIPPEQSLIAIDNYYDNIDIKDGLIKIQKYLEINNEN